MGETRKIAAILVADVVGYSRLAGADEERMLVRLRSLRSDLIDPAIAYLYRFRNLVERFFNKLKHFRAVATRYEKHDANYLALVKLAAIRIWFRFMSR
jgi:transposase